MVTSRTEKGCIAQFRSFCTLSAWRGGTIGTFHGLRLPFWVFLSGEVYQKFDSVPRCCLSPDRTIQTYVQAHRKARHGSKTLEWHQMALHHLLSFRTHQSHETLAATWKLRRKPMRSQLLKHCFRFCLCLVAFALLMPCIRSSAFTALCML